MNAQDGTRTGPGCDVVDTKLSPDSNVNKSTKSNASPANARNTHQLPSQNNHQSHNHHINNNMVPIISVTPHSPGAKFNNILGKFAEKLLFVNINAFPMTVTRCPFAEDTLNQLQHIRESVVQMKNSSSNNHHHYCTASGLINPAVSIPPPLSHISLLNQWWANNFVIFFFFMLFIGHLDECVSFIFIVPIAARFNRRSQ